MITTISSKTALYNLLPNINNPKMLRMFFKLIIHHAISIVILNMFYVNSGNFVSPFCAILWWGLYEMYIVSIGDEYVELIKINLFNNSEQSETTKSNHNTMDVVWHNVCIIMALVKHLNMIYIIFPKMNT